MKTPGQILTWKNIINTIFIILVVVLIVSPQAKAVLIRAVIKIGIMRPPTKSEVSSPSTAPVSVALLQPDGVMLNTNKFKGKVLIMNFWATWCPPCIAEMPSLNEMYLHYSNHSSLMVLPVDVDNEFAKSITFIRHNGYSLPVYTLAGKLPAGLVSNAIPVTLIIDKSGRIVARHEGAADYSSAAFYKFIDTLLKQ